ncbi:MAG: response regulator [Bdellovibrionaceae bacterium]|nr:response regulator [Pseudobdellovibrionaceae bacterium]
MKILVVESHADIRYLVEEFLRRKLDDIEVAATGNAEVAAADLQAGGFGGLVIGSIQHQAAQELSRLAQDHDTFVVLFASSSETANIGSAAAAVIRQPDFQRLIEVVGELVVQEALRRIGKRG